MFRKLHTFIVYILPLVSFFFMSALVILVKFYHIDSGGFLGCGLFFLTCLPMASTITYLSKIIPEMVEKLNKDSVLSPFAKIFFMNGKEAKDFPGLTLHKNKKDFSVEEFSFSASFPSCEFKIVYQKSERQRVTFLTHGYNVVVIHEEKNGNKYKKVSKSFLTKTEFEASYGDVIERLKGYHDRVSKKETIITPSQIATQEIEDIAIILEESIKNKEKVKSKL